MENETMNTTPDAAEEEVVVTPEESTEETPAEDPEQESTPEEPAEEVTPEDPPTEEESPSKEPKEDLPVEEAPEEPTGPVLTAVKIEQCYVIDANGYGRDTVLAKFNTYSDGSNDVNIRGGVMEDGDQLISMPTDEDGKPIDERMYFVKAKWNGSEWEEGATEDEIAAWNASERIKLEQWVREERTRRLAATDWTQVLDNPIDAATREAYRVYRQALRDVTEQERFPLYIEWPVLPEKVKAAPDPVDTILDVVLGVKQ